MLTNGERSRDAVACESCVLQRNPGTAVPLESIDWPIIRRRRSLRRAFYCRPEQVSSSGKYETLGKLTQLTRQPQTRALNATLAVPAPHADADPVNYNGNYCRGAWPSKPKSVAPQDVGIQIPTRTSNRLEFGSLSGFMTQSTSSRRQVRRHGRIPTGFKTWRGKEVIIIRTPPVHSNLPKTC